MWSWIEWPVYVSNKKKKTPFDFPIISTKNVCHTQYAIQS